MLDKQNSCFLTVTKVLIVKISGEKDSCFLTVTKFATVSD